MNENDPAVKLKVKYENFIQFGKVLKVHYFYTLLFHIDFQLIWYV